jgi:hypothetical protein
MNAALKAVSFAHEPHLSEGVILDVRCGVQSVKGWRLLLLLLCLHCGENLVQTLGRDVQERFLCLA